MKGTIPGAENTQDFKDALLEVDPELKDFAYAPESYDAVILTALAAAVAKSDAGVDMAKQMVPITNGTEICNDYAGCLALIEEGKAIDYNGRSGAVNFWDAGDPTAPPSASTPSGRTTSCCPRSPTWRARSSPRVRPTRSTQIPRRALATASSRSAPSSP